MRQRYQQGCLRTTKDGYFVGQWREGGKLRSRVLGKVGKTTKANAKEALAGIVKPLNEQAVPEQDITLRSFIEQKYLPFYKGKWKASTAMTNQDRINHHIVGTIGDRLVRTITRDELQALLDANATLSFSTVAHLRWDLKQVFDFALAEGIVQKNPAVLLFTPRACKHPEQRSLSRTEVKQVLGALELRERVIVELAVMAGMRPGEIFGLKRCHVTSGAVSIEQRVYRGTIDTPKTEKSKRVAAISSGLREDLDAWLNRDPEGQPDDWLFPSETLKTPLAKDNVMYRNIRPVLKRIGMEWVDFHVLRRTHASLMRELGVDPKVVADQQGHTVDVNLNVYTQTSLAQRTDAVEQLAAVVH
jgi:integrase